MKGKRFATIEEIKENMLSMYGYDIETKNLTSQWKSPEEPRLKKTRQVWTNVKVLLTVFLDCNGLGAS